MSTSPPPPPPSPENTIYSSPDAFDELESEMLQIVKEGEYTEFLDDCKAKTGQLLYYVEITEAFLDIFYLDDVDLIEYMYDYEKLVKSGVSLSRNSSCNCRPNAFGHKFLDFF